MKHYSVSKCNKKFEKIRSTQQVIALKEPSIMWIKKKYGNAFIKAYIALWIVHLSDFLNLGKSLNDVQVKEISRLIANNFQGLSIAEIYLIINNIKMGYYGKLYDRLDGSMIMIWFNQYLDERCNSFEQLSIQESNIYRGQWNFNINNIKR